MRLVAVPAPRGTTTAIFHVHAGIVTWLLYSLLVVKLLGPQVISNSFPALANERH